MKDQMTDSEQLSSCNQQNLLQRSEDDISDNVSVVLDLSEKLIKEGGLNMINEIVWEMQSQVEKLKIDYTSQERKLTQYESIIRKQQAMIAQLKRESISLPLKMTEDERELGVKEVMNTSDVTSPSTTPRGERHTPRPDDQANKLKQEISILEKRCKLLERENAHLVLQTQGKSNTKIQEVLLKANQNHKREQERLQLERINETQSLEKKYLELKRTSKKEVEKIQRDKSKIEEQLKQEIKVITALKRQVQSLENERDSLRKRIQVETKKTPSRVHTAKPPALISPRQRLINSTSTL